MGVPFSENVPLGRVAGSARRAMLVTAIILLPILLGAASFAAEPEHDFYTATADAMTRMHQAIAVIPTGDPDRDFAAMMIPHHQAAIDMAQAELLHGKDERLRRLAQGIIVEQKQEIELMRAILSHPRSNPAPNVKASGQEMRR